MILALGAALAGEGDALYFVLVDRFADGREAGEIAPDDPQGWHGGDLRGVLDHLDDIPGQGLWLSPIQASRQDKVGEWGAFHGYWTVDLGSLEPRLATEAELTELSERLNDRDAELWLDLVTNHVGYEAPLIEEHPDWFHGKGDVKDWADPVQAVTHDVHGLPDLAQEKDEVYAWILQGATRWVELAKPTGFRVDAVRHLPDGFLARLRADLRKVDPDLQMLGELFEGDPRVLSERQRADQLDRVFDFPLYYGLTDAMCRAQPGRLAGVLGQDGLYDDPSSLVTFLDNHDLPRIRSVCGSDDATARALAMLLTLRGTPCLTYGTEAALEGEHEPANRVDMVFEPQPLRPALDALLELRQKHEVLGRSATTRVLDVDDTHVTIGRESSDQHARITWTTAERPFPASECERLVVTGANGPVPAEQVMPANSVAIEICGGRYDGAEASWFEAEPPLAKVKLEVPDGYRLVGSGPVLGFWDADKGIDPKKGWVKLKLPAGTVLEYKLVQRGDDGWKWPDSGNTVVIVGR